MVLPKPPSTAKDHNPSIAGLAGVVFVIQPVAAFHLFRQRGVWLYGILWVRVFRSKDQQV
jgi:hypothetical protein